MTTSAQHSSASNEHYTPPAIIEAARATMGGIDLDPATTAEVNRGLVRAADFFTKEDNGLAKPWHGRVWLNPPGGRVGTRSNAAVWWNKPSEDLMQMTRQNLGEEKAEGETKEAERLAMFLACWSEILHPPTDKLEVLAIWNGKRPTAREGYRRAATALLGAWKR